MSDVKRIALFLDGTWNNTDDNTNVYRAKSLCNKSPEQLCYYSAGVGTQKGEKLTGGMFGIGIHKEVLSAYEWLVDHYEPEAKIFIFGFSRGAFTARSLAGFISVCGLLKPGSPISLTQLYERYRSGKAKKSILTLSHAAEADLSQEDVWLRRYSQPVPLWFQGVWDTVGALGVPMPWLPNVSSNSFAFLETDLRINDTHAYHALAIDEHRKAFAPTLWVKETPKQGVTSEPREMAQVEQRWFAGAHANFGGGYENDLLAQIPLQWLMSKAVNHGLIFTSDVTLDGDEATCLVRDSLAEMAHGLYAAATFGRRYFRPIGAPAVDNGSSTTAAINETIDASVFERWRKVSDYRPQNLVDWAARHNVDPALITSHLYAADPALPVP